MAGGTIYKKQIVSGVEQGTGDNNLIIDSKYAYQVPFTFQDDWNEINIGVFLSFVRGDANNLGFPTGDSAKDSGGSTNDTFTWIGLAKNAHTKSLPLDLVNQGFVGYAANNISFKNSIGINDNKLLDSISGNASGISTYGAGILSSAQIFPDALTSPNQGAIICVGLDTGSSYANTEGSGDFCSYFGIKYTVINKGLANQKIKMQMCQASDTSPNIGNPAHIFSDPSSAELRRLLEGDQAVGTYSNAMTGLNWNIGGASIALPDSFFFYNGFDTGVAQQNVRPRIHAWSVKKIS